MVHALMNMIRRTGSYLATEEIVRIVQGDLSAQNLETLKELARIFQVRGITRKADLVAELRQRVAELLTAPLTYQGLIQEAHKRDIQTVGFSYQDLRVLCGYDVVQGAGIVYLPIQHRTSLGTILVNTEPGSHQRLSRLMRDDKAMAEWNNRYPECSAERDLYRALFARGVPLTPELEVQPLLYITLTDSIGYLLLQSAPGSALRRQLLQDYDPALLQEFSRHHGVCGDLMTQVVLPRARVPESQFYYTHDQDPLLVVLSTTAPNTLKRYVMLAPLEISADYLMEYSLEDFCAVPQLEDQRPQKLRDYEPMELLSLPLPVLQAFAVREGLYPYGTAVTQDVDTLLDGLQLSYVAPTFIQPGMIERTEQVHTSLHTTLEDVASSQLYAYGIRDGTGQYTYFEREELKGSFLASGGFSNPYTNEPFSRQAIQRLYVLSLNDQSEGAEEFRQCLKTLLTQNAVLNNEERLLVNYFRDHLEVVPAFEALVETGMYMRRWDGNLAKYPLTVAETRPPPDAPAGEEDQHFQRVENAMERLQRTIDALPVGLRQKFWGLPLRNYMRSGYYSSQDPDDGKTLRDRYNIVREGNHPSAPMSSCIRTSSGWFIFTALYYYGKIFNENLRGLRPHQIEFIS